jgi:NADPH-dependent curcumin reductase CurA
MEERDSLSPGKGQLVVETKLLSLDPTHFNWVKCDPALQFLPIGVGDTMLGTNIGVVLESTDPAYSPGQKVMGLWGWEQISVADTAYLAPALDEAEMPFPDQLTILSHVGLAAGGGMLIVGAVAPGDAVLVSAAAGATGSIAAQIARAKGCRTVGIAGGPEKCRFLVEELGLAAAIDYRAPGLPEAIAQHFPAGVDLFFDNVGGGVLDAVLQNMAPRCRIVICGAIAQYDRSSDSGFTGIRNLPMLIFRQARMEGFVAGQFGARNAEVGQSLLDLYRDGKLRVPTQLTAFEDMPETLTLLLSGKNQGKLIANIC